jgi:uncharacterized phage protein (TIGR02218 family)
MGAIELYSHLATGCTTSCNAWSVVRKDGATFGFTDHDRDLQFDGIRFRADTGLSARALMQTTGLSVDNSEAVGALSDAAITEADLGAGRFDGAAVIAWAVNWADVGARVVLFRGSFGEVVRSAGTFRAELRGLSEVLNAPQGRAFQKGCGAVLGDDRCKFNTATPGFQIMRAVEVVDGAEFRFGEFAGIEDRWFDRGRLEVMTGAAAGLFAMIKNDRRVANGRAIALWQTLGLQPRVGDTVRLTAGCDRRMATCVTKFNNFNNFRGFPHIPGEDWLASYPVSSNENAGGSLNGEG